MFQNSFHSQTTQAICMLGKPIVKYAMCLGNYNWDKPVTLDWNQNKYQPLTCNYIDIEETNKLINISEFGGLNVMHLNIRSQKAKTFDLTNMLCELENNNIVIHVLLLCETYITALNVDLCQINGYSLIYKARGNSHGGGVSIMIHKDLNYTKKDVSAFYTEKTTELIAIELHLKSKKILLAECYHSPNNDPKTFIKIMDDFLKNITKDYSTIILSGDFNFNLLNISHHLNASVLDLFTRNLFEPLITIPTRVTHKSATLIDNIYLYNKDNTNPNLGENSSYVILDDISDHFPCLSIFPNIYTVDKKSYKYEFRKITTDGVTKCNHDLLNTNWDNVLCNDIDTDYDSFMNVLNCSLDKHLPMKTEIGNADRPYTKSWYTKNIQKYRRKAKQLYLRSIKDPSKVQEYRNYRNSLNRLIRYERQTYYTEKFKKFRNNINCTWSLINGLIKKNHNKNDVISAITDNDGTLLTDPNEVCNRFRNYFMNNVSQLVPNTVNPEACTKYLKSKEGDKFEPNNISDRCVEKVIGNMENKTSMGYDKISNKLMKLLVTGLRKPPVYVDKQIN